MSSVNAGWSVEAVVILGDRQRVGDEHFRHGVRPQVRALPVADGEDVLVVVDEVGDVLAYRDLDDQPRGVPLLHQMDGAWKPLGRAAFPGPEHYKYAAAWPRAEGGFDLVLSFAQFEQTYRLPGGEQPLHFGPRQPLTKCVGVPEVIDWRRDGSFDLLLGGDGAVRRLPGGAGEPQVVMSVDGPIGGAGLLHISVVDMLGRGGRDLLVTDGKGDVVLHLDLSPQSEPRYDRGRVLAQVEGGGSAAVVRQRGRRWLVVADAKGRLWRYELLTAPSQVLRDWSRYTGGGWSLLREGDLTLLAAAPATLPPAREEDRLEVARFDPPASELHIPLPGRGWHEIFITLRRPAFSAWEPRIVAQLSDQPASQVMMGLDRHREPRQEMHLATVNLNGQTLRLRQMEAEFHATGAYPTWLESVRLAPVAAPLASGPRLHTAAIFDAFMWNNHVATSSQRHIDDMIAWHRSAGFDIVYYKMGGAAWEYPSRVAGAESVDPVPFEEFSDVDRAYCQRVKRMWESFDRFGASIDACHRLGMRCFGWLRIQNENEHFHGKYPLSRFYADHTHLCEKDINGDAVRGKLCLGYPQVRRFYVELVLEAMHKGVDGIMIDTMRHLPKVMYGDPIVEMFKREHGLDMRSLPPMDARVMRLQCRVMTEFLREVGEAMRSVTPDAPLHVRVCKPYPLMGVDPSAWAREGLVDAVLIEDRVGSQRPDLPGLREATQGTNCQAAYSFTRAHWGRSDWPLSPRRIAGEMNWALQQGATLAAFYESAAILEYPEFCRAIRALSGGDGAAARTILE